MPLGGNALGLPATPQPKALKGAIYPACPKSASITSKVEDLLKGKKAIIGRPKARIIDFLTFPSA